MTADHGTAEEHGWLPVTRSRTYELVLDRIEEQIASGRLRVGDRLPAERDLAGALGVSRVAVREALRVLQAMGLISQGTGSGREAGTILTSAPGEALTRLIRMHVLVASVGSDDLVGARITLERESARLAAGNASDADRAELARLLSEMERPRVEVEAFNDADTAFHVAIARASGNVLVAELTTALRNAMRATLLERLRAEPDFGAVADRLSAEHRALYQALLAGDGATAADLVQRHIEDFYRLVSPEAAPPGRRTPRSGPARG
jgi:GntR family transcriptional repressor for pyruvate dehydrogenase complex